MKILTFGDRHGRNDWKKIVSPEYDKIVFLGDYWDSFDIPFEQQRENFIDLLEYKRANFDRVVLLTGNHDFHYVRGIRESYSGYQTIHRLEIQELLDTALGEDMMTACFLHNNILFSHAGVTKTWCKNNDVDVNNIEQSINDLFKYIPRVFEFTSGKNYSVYGDDVEQGPFWVRPRSLKDDSVDFIQVVGHTTIREPLITDKFIFADCPGRYVIYEDKQFRVGDTIK